MVNKVILVGRLGKDPEVRHINEGNTAVASFSIATDESYKDREGNKQQRTEWHNITAWRNQALFAEKYLKKGTLIYLEGKIRNRSYEDKQGVKKYITEIVVDNFMILSPKREDQGGQTPHYEQTPARGGEDQGSNAMPDDDLPF